MGPDPDYWKLWWTVAGIRGRTVPPAGPIHKKVIGWSLGQAARGVEFSRMEQR